MKNTVCIIISVLLFIPVLIFPSAAVASDKLADGTMIYYEDFNYSDISGNAVVLSLLGWSLSEDLNKNTAHYSIDGGRLLCDNLTSTVGGTPQDSYLTILDDAAMSEVTKGNYTISYDLTYVSAENAQRYVAMIYNYNGYQNYNTVHIRIGGTGNNQVRYGGSNFKTYDSTGATAIPDTPGYLSSNGDNSIANKVFGVSPSTSKPFPLVNRTMTVTIKVDKEKGPSVYINGVFLSNPNTIFSELFEASQTYSSAVALKTSHRVKAYVDNMAIWTGLGKMPENKKVTYKYPVAPDNGNEISVMSFNILYSDGNAVAFTDGLKRTEHIVSIVSGMRPDVIGFQEMQNSTVKGGITDVLSTYGYAAADSYRTDTTSSNIISCTPIVYNTSTFELVENSSSNGRLAHGNLVYSNSYQTTGKSIKNSTVYTKSLSWAVLKNKASGQLVLAMNTHFSVYVDTYNNYSSDDAIRDRVKNAEQAISKMKEVYARFGNLPTFFTGDFNSRQNEECYRVLLSQFGDSIHLAPDSILYEYTMSNKNTTINNPAFLRTANAPIDHIFVTTENFTVNSYNVLNDCDEQMVASDHCAIMAKMTLEPVSAPTCSHSTGIYSGTQNVTLNGSGTLFYTTDNSDPRTSKTRKSYSSAIKLSSDTILRYVSFSEGAYSNVERRTLYFGTPFYITEAIKNSPGNDLYEGIEIMNVSSVPLDLSDFCLWEYRNIKESEVKNVVLSSVVTNMRISHKDGEYTVAPGDVVYIATIFSDHYLKKATIASGKSVHYCEMDPATGLVNYRTDYMAQGIAHDKAGTITAERIIPLDRTARVIGFTADGTLFRRRDYQSTETGNVINNITDSFNLGNDTFNRLFVTFADARNVSRAFCICDLDSTGNGTVNTGSGAKGSEGSYRYLPTAGSSIMKTAGFTSKQFSIGILTEDQKPAFTSVNRSGSNKYLTEETIPETTVESTPAATGTDNTEVPPQTGTNTEINTDTDRTDNSSSPEESETNESVHGSGTVESESYSTYADPDDTETSKDTPPETGSEDTNCASGDETESLYPDGSTVPTDSTGKRSDNDGKDDRGCNGITISIIVILFAAVCTAAILFWRRRYRKFSD